MKEKEWVSTIIPEIEQSLQHDSDNLKVVAGRKLPYSNEILSYSGNKPDQQNYIAYETDILILEQVDEDNWKPRIIIETKINKVTTHDAITYSQKAQTHKYVHPYLRYGILIGNRKHYPLPGRLFRHGQHFDFMLSWKTYDADEKEWQQLIEILKDEVEASRALEEMIFKSRSRSRMKYTSLHKPLRLGG